LVGDGCHLHWCVGAVANCSKINGIFDLVEEDFDGLIGVIVSFHLFIIGKDVRGT
jgi:hypothetical protein